MGQLLHSPKHVHPKKGLGSPNDPPGLWIPVVRVAPLTTSPQLCPSRAGASEVRPLTLCRTPALPPQPCGTHSVCWVLRPAPYTCHCWHCRGPGRGAQAASSPGRTYPSAVCLCPSTRGSWSARRFEGTGALDGKRPEENHGGARKPFWEVKRENMKKSGQDVVWNQPDVLSLNLLRREVDLAQKWSYEESQKEQQSSPTTLVDSHSL